MWEKRKCLTCKKIFNFRNCPVDIKEKKGKFCCRKCFFIYQNKRIEKKCLTCGKLGKWKRKYCSHKCYWKSISIKLSGKNANGWKGGKWRGKDGYVYIHQPKHPYSAQNNYIKRSRSVVEKYIGRYVSSIEIIHHINEIKGDDRPENLYLFPNRAEHCRHHGWKNMPKLKSNII